MIRRQAQCLLTYPVQRSAFGLADFSDAEIGSVLTLNTPTGLPVIR